MSPGGTQCNFQGMKPHGRRFATRRRGAKRLDGWASTVDARDMALALCASCARHVRASETVCPFCGGTRGEAVPLPLSRATRAALVFGSATMVVAGMACGGTLDPTDAGTATDASARPDSSAVPLYGAPVPPYGVPPPPDAGADVGPVPAYGLPAPRDAGND